MKSTETEVGLSYRFRGEAGLCSAYVFMSCSVAGNRKSFVGGMLLMNRDRLEPVCGDKQHIQRFNMCLWLDEIPSFKPSLTSWTQKEVSVVIVLIERWKQQKLQTAAYFCCIQHVVRLL